MSSPDPLAVLEVAERNELESLLMEFDGNWRANSLDEYGRRVALNPDQQYRRVALAELVKVDLHRNWSGGNGRLLDEYLDQFPTLGNTESVTADLILAEYEARSTVDPELALASYESRFPKRFQQVKQLAGELFDSSMTDSSSPKRTEKELAQASIDTSRVDQLRDTKDGKKRDTVVELPVEFGRYRILKELGSGAMGRVYLAHDSQLDRQVALKTPSFSGSNDDDMVTRFYREARSAAKIQHRNICPIYDVGEIDGRHVISMAFVKGRCMSDFIKPGKMPPQRTSAILVQRLAVALAEAHRHNVIHRDLKPTNIMIDLKKEPIVMDFGLARQMDVESSVTQSGMAVGTPAYMSPEQIRGELDEVGTTADIYALGVILYELLTGRLPFRGPIAKVVYAIVHDEPAAPSTINPEIEPELEAICAKMMAKDRDQRYQSMDDVAANLKSYLKDVGKKPIANSSSSSRNRAETTSDSSTAQLTETGALNAFFAAQADADSRGTLVEPAANSQAATLPTQRRTSGRSDRNRRGRNPWIALGSCGGAALLLGVIIYFNGGKVELDSDSDAVVNVDHQGNVSIRPGSDTKQGVAAKEPKQAISQATPIATNQLELSLSNPKVELLKERQHSGADLSKMRAQPSSTEPTKTEAPTVRSSPDDRDIAEKIVGFGGSVQLVGSDKWIWTIPEGDIRVVGVSFFRKQKHFGDKHIALLGQLPSLQTVIFYPNDMTTEGIATLAKMENVVENVEVLRFNRVALGPKTLAALAKLKRLDTLTLHHTDLIDDDLKLLANLPALEELILQQHSKKKFGQAFLTDDCLKHLKTVRGLRKLTLIGQQFTDACLVNVAELHLEELWLATPNVTDRAVAQLRENRPRLGVTRFRESPEE
ncbi:serine/threonine-protein kinase [Aporhodopirellula aestuarii]|uniref:Serine/threonine protein kinase n=1 Tax=Aporhodopirellula aestuarii TaxID=2950107 RepID=A0ABT0U7H5_9BACT|nr:serine/threonine-protein kinase [Aporhodopirellula aestuarii]MCM2372741.1 serine/threonine protein kinase [Aporhodopirellula aestuarii]